MTDEVHFVLDGGSLVQRLQYPWKRGCTFETIIQAYVKFVKEKYPRAVIVFDGYTSGPSTKDMTHLRRSKGIKGRPVHFTHQMAFKQLEISF